MEEKTEKKPASEVKKQVVTAIQCHVAVNTRVMNKGKVAASINLGIFPDIKMIKDPDGCGVLLIHKDCANEAKLVPWTNIQNVDIKLV